MNAIPEVVGSNFGFHQHSFDYFLRAMNTLDLHEIELWAIASHFDFPGGGAGEVERVARQLRGADLQVYCLTLEQVMYPLNIAAPNADLARRSVDQVKRAAEAAATLGASLLFVTSGRGLRDVPRAQSWRRAVDGVREIVEHAGQLGITCVMEPLQPHESDLVNSVADLAQFDAEVGDDRLRVVIDTVAMTVAGDTVADYFARFPGRVGHVHLVDGNPAGHLAWGDGELPLAEYARELRSRGYSGKVGFEVFGPPSYREDPVRALEQCLAGYRAAMAGL